jgi:hypothetical protein
MKRTKVRTLGIVAVLAALTLVSSAHAGEIGHFGGGVLNIRDYVMPDAGLTKQTVRRKISI